MRELTPIECKTYIENSAEKPLLLDVREPWEHRIAALEGARLIPMREIPAAAETLNPAQEIIVICHHGIRSRHVAHYLESRGFDRVINLRGGVDAWARELDTRLSTY
jgi:rhodanese-related sulfurtransferase